MMLSVSAIASEKITGKVLIEGVRHTVSVAVSYTHLRAHETVLDLVCRLLLEKKNAQIFTSHNNRTPIYRELYNTTRSTVHTHDKAIHYSLTES